MFDFKKLSVLSPLLLLGPSAQALDIYSPAELVCARPGVAAATCAVLACGSVWYDIFVSYPQWHRQYYSREIDAEMHPIGFENYFYKYLLGFRGTPFTKAVRILALVSAVGAIYFGRRYQWPVASSNSSKVSKFDGDKTPKGSPDRDLAEVDGMDNRSPDLASTPAESSASGTAGGESTSRGEEAAPDSRVLRPIPLRRMSVSFDNPPAASVSTTSTVSIGNSSSLFRRVGEDSARSLPSVDVLEAGEEGVRKTPAVSPIIVGSLDDLGDLEVLLATGSDASVPLQPSPTPPLAPNSTTPPTPLGLATVSKTPAVPASTIAAPLAALTPAEPVDKAAHTASPNAVPSIPWPQPTALATRSAPTPPPSTRSGVTSSAVGPLAPPAFSTAPPLVVSEAHHLQSRPTEHMAARHRELTPLQQAKDCFRQARKELRKIVVYPTQSDRPAIVAQVQQMLDQAEQHLRDVVAQAKAEEAEAVKHLKALPARLRALLCKLRAENIDPATMAELKALVRLRRRR